MNNVFTPSFFSEIQGEVLQRPEFLPLVIEAKATGNYSRVNNDYNIRTQFDEEILKALLQARRFYRPADWKDLFECVESMPVIAYHHAFVMLAEKILDYVFCEAYLLQEYTRLRELEPTEWSFPVMLQKGEVWDNLKHAELRVRYIYLQAKAYRYVRSIETVFREGGGYAAARRLNPASKPWCLPELFPYGAEWYDQPKAIVYGLCDAFGLFIEDTVIDVPVLCTKASAPVEVIHQAVELREKVLAAMK